MTVFVNDETFEFSENPTLIEVLNQQGINELHGLALAINEEVIPRAEWSAIKLESNDRLMLIRATQGG
ncbi:sulfur carrier protein ThiS [Arcicella lustrica]|uniref:Sulfur carrier protein ThiS n=1 Tax=Arcicella lustrica TaxID=2984196 RepID=A0ABU5SMZ9_9BACT|nr:sulfur carrier protein ThiS [Arcicella sp. DC25W]MEA5428690.1 sulfur carrier protein ThiS [Arcicella sp. DC25W]